jgi:hypothetical protein
MMNLLDTCGKMENWELPLTGRGSKHRDLRRDIFGGPRYHMLPRASYREPVLTSERTTASPYPSYGSGHAISPVGSHGGLDDFQWLLFRVCQRLPIVRIGGSGSGNRSTWPRVVTLHDVIVSECSSGAIGGSLSM